MTGSIARSLCSSWASCSMRYGDLTICNMSAVRHRHLEFSKFKVYFTWPASMAFCFPVHSTISLKWDNRLLSSCQKNFLKWRLSAIWNFFKFIFGYLAVIEFQMCCCVPDFIEIGWFFVEILWRFNDLHYVCLSKKSSHEVHEYWWACRPHVELQRCVGLGTAVKEDTVWYTEARRCRAAPCCR